MISVLVVDDSTFMRNTITALLEQDSDIKIVGTARNGQEALQKAEELDPDVMTLDVDLPRLDGLGVLQQLMKKNTASGAYGQLAHPEWRRKHTEGARIRSS